MFFYYSAESCWLLLDSLRESSHEILVPAELDTSLQIPFFLILCSCILPMIVKA